MFGFLDLGFGSPSAGLEIRRTPPTVWAVAEGPANGAFRRLAGYIKSAGIAMTTPVLIWRDTTPPRMAFTMPSGDLPAPADPGVRLVPKAAETVAVRSFRGRATAASVNQQAALLIAEATGAGHRVAGPVRLAAYSNPMTTLPMFRRHEVQVPLSGPE